MKSMFCKYFVLLMEYFSARQKNQSSLKREQSCCKKRYECTLAVNLRGMMMEWRTRVKEKNNRSGNQATINMMFTPSKMSDSVLKYTTPLEYFTSLL